MQLESQAPANRAGFYCKAIAPCRGSHRRLTTIGYDSGDLRDTWHCSQHYKTILGLPSWVTIYKAFRRGTCRSKQTRTSLHFNNAINGTRNWHALSRLFILVFNELISVEREMVSRVTNSFPIMYSGQNINLDNIGLKRQHLRTSFLKHVFA